MKLSEFGSLCQFSPGTEGNLLQQLGLLSVAGNEVHPTERLKTLFGEMPPLKDVYEALVELVLAVKY